MSMILFYSLSLGRAIMNQMQSNIYDFPAQWIIIIKIKIIHQVFHEGLSRELIRLRQVS